MRGARLATRLALVVVIAAGAALRLVYPDDIEFKADERWSFEQAQAVIDGEPWPALGMPMSVGGRNPGLSVWVFVGLAWVSGATTPPELARAVQILNVVALLIFVALAWRLVGDGPAREGWLWAAALWAANPAAIVFERKIWPPSVFPLTTVCLMVAWWHRQTRVGSFFLGVLAGIVAQIHPVSALFPAALIVWALAGDRRSIRWTPLIAGAMLSALPAVPWLFSLHEAGSESSWRMLPLPYFYRRLLLQPFGLSAHHTLGLADFRAFMTWPTIGGVPTWLGAVSHAAAATAMLIVYGRALRTVWGLRAWHPASFVIGADPQGQMIRAALLGYGGILTLITLTGAGAERHYMIVITPLMALWVARLAALPGRGTFGSGTRMLLGVACGAQLLMAALLLHYIHHTAVIDGEYGATWAAQQDGLAPPPRAIQLP